MVKYKQIQCKSALHKVLCGNSYYYDLNVYRGCYFRCKYCYALYSHKYLDSRNFFDEIFIKSNIVEMLDEKLSSKSWDNSKLIHIGSVCDTYQPIDDQCKIMPEILNLLIKHRVHTSIFTKSNLILRDIELIDRLSRVAYVNISTTVTTLDAELAKVIEPNAIDGEARLNILKTLQTTNVDLDINIMPIMPMLTENGLEDIFVRAKELGIFGIRAGSLIIKDETRKLYLNFIRTTFPNLYEKYLTLYKGSYLCRNYQNKIDQRIEYLRNKYDMGEKSELVYRVQEDSNLQWSLF